MAKLRCPISNGHVPVPVPTPCPHLRSIIGHVAGWTRPYSRLRYTRATLTGLQGLRLNELLETARFYGRGCLVVHSFAYLLTYGFNNSLHSLRPRWPVRGLMQGAYHIGTVDSVDVFGPIWAGKPHPPFARAMPCHTQGDTTTLNHETAIPHIKKGLASSRSAPYPCHAITMPCHAPPLLSPCLVSAGSHITIAHTLHHEVHPSSSNTEQRLTDRLANSFHTLCHGTRPKALGRAYLLASWGYCDPRPIPLPPPVPF